MIWCEFVVTDVTCWEYSFGENLWKNSLAIKVFVISFLFTKIVGIPQILKWTNHLGVHMVCEIFWCACSIFSSLFFILYVHPLASFEQFPPFICANSTTIPKPVFSGNFGGDSLHCSPPCIGVTPTGGSSCFEGGMVGQPIRDDSLLVGICSTYSTHVWNSTDSF